MLTVVFATRDRAEILARVLSAYARLDTPSGGWRLIVVDNGSTDATASLLRSWSDRLPLSVLAEPRAGKNRALNAAIPHLEGDLTVWTDDDAIPARDWLVRLREAADAHPDATMFGGTVELDWPGPAPPWLTAESVDLSVLYARNLRATGPCDHTAIYGPNMAIRRHVFDAGRLRFSESVGPDASRAVYPMGGETELLRRLGAAGHLAWFAAEARVRHIVRLEQLEEAWILGRAYRYGLGEGRQHLGRLGVVGLALRALAANAAALMLLNGRASPRRIRALYRARCLSGAMVATARALPTRTGGGVPRWTVEAQDAGSAAPRAAKSQG